jgi:hypothetical protein
MFGSLRVILTGEAIIMAAFAIGAGLMAQADNLFGLSALSVGLGIMAHMMWRTVRSIDRARLKK